MKCLQNPQPKNNLQKLKKLLTFIMFGDKMYKLHYEEKQEQVEKPAPDFLCF